MSAGDGSLLLQSNTRGSEELINLLEERVALLVQRYRQTRETVEELRVRVSEGEAQCVELTSELAALTGELVARDQLHVELRQRLDRLLEQFGKLELPSAEDPRSVGGGASA